MKTIKHISLLILACLVMGSCQDGWNQHYQAQELQVDGEVSIYKGNAADYLQANYSEMHQMLGNAGILAQMNPEQDYSIIVYANDLLSASGLAGDTAYASFCISDVACSPSALWNGMGLSTWQGKTIWVEVKNGQILLGGCPVNKVVKTDDAYLYVIEEKMLSVLPSVYDAIMALDDNYSEFKKLVKRHERTYFDPDKCTPIGTNAQGNTIYSDSIKGWVTENTLMDRYTEEGQEMWNMRSETYNNTVFVPSNELIKAVIDTALAKVPRWLGRKATAADRAKYENWLLRACFVDRELSDADVCGNKDIDCVGGFTRDTENNNKLSAADVAMWRPTVQKVRTDDKMKANNGTLYFIDWMKVPNNVIIYRLKSRFYELWNNSTAEQHDKYFRWTHWIDPMIINDAQGSFTLSETLPTMYYHVLTAIPDKEARRDTLPCSVTYDGLLYLPNNPRGQQIVECCIPAGEYYLRMGFKHSLEYSLSIQFNDTVLIEDMVMYAQGSNYHFDRGSVSVVDNYGESSIGYPEGYNWHDWSSLSEKAQAYDTDGFQVGIVNVKEEGNFTITITSNDMSRLYDYSAQRNTSNVKQLMMYHWCLRPTKNNY